MKSKNVIFICILVFLCSLTTQSQDSSNTGFLKKLSFRAGYVISSINNYNSYSRLTDICNLLLSVSYDYNKQLQFDISYRYLANLSSLISNNAVDEFYYTSHYKTFNSYMFSLKANYFLSKNRDSNPVYFTGGITGSIQPVHEWLSGYYNKVDTMGGFTSYIHDQRIGSYNRLLLGPEVGGGIYLNFGKVSFQSELTYSARFSLFRDRGYRELSFSLFNGLVYKF